MRTHPDHPELQAAACHALAEYARLLAAVGASFAGLADCGAPALAVQALRAHPDAASMACALLARLCDDDAAAEEGEGLARRVVGEEGEQGLADVAAEAGAEVTAVALVAQRVEEDLRRREYV